MMIAVLFLFGTSLSYVVDGGIYPEQLENYGQVPNIVTPGIGYTQPAVAPVLVPDGGYPVQGPDGRIVGYQNVYSPGEAVIDRTKNPGYVTGAPGEEKMCFPLHQKSKEEVIKAGVIPVVSVTKTVTQTATATSSTAKTTAPKTTVTVTQKEKATVPPRPGRRPREEETLTPTLMDPEEGFDRPQRKGRHRSEYRRPEDRPVRVPEYGDTVGRGGKKRPAARRPVYASIGRRRGKRHLESELICQPREAVFPVVPAEQGEGGKPVSDGRVRDKKIEKMIRKQLEKIEEKASKKKRCKKPSSFPSKEVSEDELMKYKIAYLEQRISALKKRGKSFLKKKKCISELGEKKRVLLSLRKVFQEKIENIQRKNEKLQKGNPGCGCLARKKQYI
ncbi:MAG: uncharacterized protein A8A55_0084 [Amphiamblys sp. WSBS2006]|nr:MAG: uncharacterized protein A8A55_0084 [Amphiamblys sp. WSBS2006]